MIDHHRHTVDNSRIYKHISDHAYIVNSNALATQECSRTFYATVLCVQCAHVQNCGDCTIHQHKAGTKPYLIDTPVRVLSQLESCYKLNLYCHLGLYTDCRDAYEQGQTQSGVYTIQPDSEPAFQAYCDMTTDGGGWTTFQRRQDGSQDFYLYWTDYENGFGDLSNEFWLGLAQMHRLIASTARTELRVDLKDFSSNIQYAQYMDFGIGDASSNYTLAVAGYSGTAGDSLSYHNNRQFSTRDRDNDNYSESCAQEFTGAWWYNRCYDSNLNGLYFLTISTDGRGVRWETFSYPESLKFSEMKLRRA